MGESNSRAPENAWKCSNCGYGLQAPTPPAACPSCGQRCEFLNVTCYTPDCAETGVDPRLKPSK